MATITDTLKTVLELNGLQQFTSGLLQAKTAVDLQTAAQTNLAPILANVGKLWTTVGGNLVLFAAAAVGAVAAIKATTEAFTALEVPLVRTSLLFQNAGRDFPIEEISAWSYAVQQSTGASMAHTAALLGQVAAFGFTKQHSEALVRAALDVEASGRMGAEGFLTAFNKALRFPGARGSRALAIELGLDTRRLLGDVDRDRQTILQMIAEKYGGIAEVMRNTTQGTLGTFVENLKTMFAQIGDLLAPWVKAVVSILDFIVRAVNLALSNLIWFFNHNPLSIITHTGSGADQLQLNAQAAQRGFGEKDSRNLDEIAANTRQVAQAIFLTSFGNAGAFTRGAATFRNLNSALVSRG